jgi:tRNA 5-methylaminomethyl-2-thiouridine biosynthesis bifunctional protein
MLEELATLWANKPGWTILDTAFQSGDHFVAICRLWRSHEAPPRVLHYVAFADEVPAEFDHLALGFNRVLLEGGAISLTLCIGPASLMLSELRMQADMLLWHRENSDWTEADCKQLALNCRLGAPLFFAPANSPMADALARQGFELHTPKQSEPSAHSVAIYAPRWNIKRSRRTVNAPLTAARCAIIGAGLSGAAAAHALALRGWQVTVYDTSPEPAGGASGLPAGLCVAKGSKDNNPQTRLSQQGVRICLAHARRLLAAGSDWNESGVIEKVDLLNPQRDVLHVHAAWLKPAALVHAWLRRPGVQWAGGRAVENLARSGAHWVLQGGDGQELGQAELVVFANAMGSRPLVELLGPQVRLADDVLRKISALQAVHGSVSVGPHTEPSQDRPMNGSGSWIGNVPTTAGPHWYAGASYETKLESLQDHAAQHADNLQRLRALCPKSAKAMEAAMAAKTVRLWSGTRCVTHDRLPLVGPLEASPSSGLWICTGMGSRGLSLAALCAELLAAYIHSEPLPLEHTLSKSLFVNRPAKGRRSAERSDSAD